jgi:hypothetical protein
MIHSGIPEEHRPFWKDLGIDGISKLYTSLAVPTEKILGIFECNSMDHNEDISRL